jgi:hypothetical protein
MAQHMRRDPRCSKASHCASPGLAFLLWEFDREALAATIHPASVSPDCQRSNCASSDQGFSKM